MKNNYLNTILILVLISLSVYNLLNTNEVRTDVKSYKKQIEKIQTNIDSAEEVNVKMNRLLWQIDNNVNSLTHKLNLVDKDIDEIKTNTNEKINSVDTIGFSDLERFFAKRYKQN